VANLCDGYPTFSDGISVAKVCDGLESVAKWIIRSKFQKKKNLKKLFVCDGLSVDRSVANMFRILKTETECFGHHFHQNKNEERERATKATFDHEFVDLGQDTPSFSPPLPPP